MQLGWAPSHTHPQFNSVRRVRGVASEFHSVASGRPLLIEQPGGWQLCFLAQGRTGNCCWSDTLITELSSLPVILSTSTSSTCFAHPRFDTTRIIISSSLLRYCLLQVYYDTTPDNIVRILKNHTTTATTSAGVACKAPRLSNHLLSELGQLPRRAEDELIAPGGRIVEQV